jgi:nucleotide-binding universal stress UspA family protein
VSNVRRVIVGASGSPGSLQVLRYAQHLTRDYDATLVPVLAWLPPCGDLADRRTPNEELRRLWAQDAHQRLQDALTLAWGTPPTDLPVQPLVRRGQPGPVLADAACRPGDLLVVGAGRRGVLARITGGRVSRYCLAHAQCPVLTVPPPPLARDTRHGALARAFWHRTLTADQISPGNGQPHNPPAAASRTRHPGSGPASGPPRPPSN